MCSKFHAEKHREDFIFYGYPYQANLCRFLFLFLYIFFYFVCVCVGGGVSDLKASKINVEL